MNWDWAKGMFLSSFGIALILGIVMLSVLFSFVLRWSIRKFSPDYRPNKWLLSTLGFLLISNCLFLDEEFSFIRAFAGRSQAQFTLGYWYTHGRGIINQSDQKAFYWFSQASNKGNTQAQKYLGYAYEKGIGTPKDLAQAINWYAKASQAGDKSAGERLKQIANSTSETVHTEGNPIP
mgnify:CR=1 FL=1|jgi:hypothetical protein